MAEGTQSNEVMDKIVSLTKRRGFIYPSSEIYSGISGFWDYGPLGVELRRNLHDAWWRHTVQRRQDVVGLDSAIMDPNDRELRSTIYSAEMVLAQDPDCIDRKSVV